MLIYSDYIIQGYSKRLLLLESCLQTSNNETVWNKFDYCVDVCRITKGAYIEHL